MLWNTYIYLTHIPKHVCTLPQTTVNYPLRNAPKLKYKLRRCAALMVFYNEEEHYLKEVAYLWKRPLRSTQLVAKMSLPNSKFTQVSRFDTDCTLRGTNVAPNQPVQKLSCFATDCTLSGTNAASKQQIHKIVMFCNRLYEICKQILGITSGSTTVKPCLANSWSLQATTSLKPTLPHTSEIKQRELITDSSP